MDAEEFALVDGPFSAGSRESESFAELVRSVFEVDYPTPGAAVPPAWQAVAVLGSDRRCVAGLEFGVLELLAGGELIRVGAIRLVCVTPSWRGRGLFRIMMARALARADENGCVAVLLYAAEAALYRPFGFEPVAQHAFVGAAPQQTGAAAPFRTLDRRDRADRDLVARLLGSRAPVSHQLAVVGAPGLFLDRVGANRSPRLAYLPDQDAIAVVRRSGATFVLVDVVAAAVPPLARILGAFPVQPMRAKLLFPPDQLGWSGTPVRTDTGLLARGTLPAALGGPWMLPPTAEF